MIFVVPSNRLVDISYGHFRLRAPKPGGRTLHRRPVRERRRRLRSRADRRDPHGQRLRRLLRSPHVKRAGGAVVIENPATAMFPSMPSSSRRLWSTRPPTSTLSDRSCAISWRQAPAEGRAHREELRPPRLDHERSGIDFGNYKPATIQRRVRGRMSATSRPTLADYLAFVGFSNSQRIRQAREQPADQSHRVLPGREEKLFDYLRVNIRTA